MRPGDTGEDPWEGSEPDRPIDIEALRADDELVEALVSGVVRAPRDRSAGTDPESELRAMLSAWVLDVRPETVTGTDLPASPAPLDPGEQPEAEPVAAPTTAPTTGPTTELPAGVIPISIGRHRLGLHPRYVQRFAAAAALVVLLGSGLAIGAWDAEPGGTLWPVAKVFYAERAKSIQAAADVSTGLERARTALKTGNRAEAAAAIAFVAAALNEVAPEQGHDLLVAQQQELVVALGDTPIPPGPTAEDPAPAAAAGAPTSDPAAGSDSPTGAVGTTAPAADPPVVTTPVDQPPADTAPVDPAPVDPGPVDTAPADPGPVDPVPPVEPPVTDPPTDPPVDATTDSAPPTTAESAPPAAQEDAPASTDSVSTTLDAPASTDGPAADSQPADSPAADSVAAAPTSSAGTPYDSGTGVDGSPGLLGTVVDVVTSVVGAILDT